MNILPKKRWHVRTKDNIARVRRDEAQAQEEERKREEKRKIAESEARLNFLRKQSGIPEKLPKADEEADKVKFSCDQHVDLFADYKSHVKTTNKDLEKEKKEEREKYEKQIGYLTYLGQDTNEALKLKSWYEVAPKKRYADDETSSKTEKDLKKKSNDDPLTLIKALLPKKNDDIKHERSASTSKKEPIVSIEALCEKGNKIVGYKYKMPDSFAGTEKRKYDSDARETYSAKKRMKSSHEKKRKSSKKHKKMKKKHKCKKRRKGDSSDETTEEEDEVGKRLQLELLRKERLKREAEERQRAELLMSSLNPEKPKHTKLESTPRVVQRYNSQFNPDLAKQNMI